MLLISYKKNSLIFRYILMCLVNLLFLVVWISVRNLYKNGEGLFLKMDSGIFGLVVFIR